jgi:2-methylcitrate dehydratase PrpD
MGATAKIARFVVETDFQSIPQEAAKIAKQHCLDCLGVALAGSVDPSGKIITEHVRGMGGNLEAVVVGGGFRTSAANAALANGTIAHALDYDDYGYPGVPNAGHPTAAIFPAALTLADKLKLSGKDLLEAYILGLEVYKSTASACGAAYDRGWHPTSIFGTMGATAACSKLLKLDVDQMRTAFGITASQTTGLLQNFGTMTKPLHAGNACRSGIVAAMLAKDGFTANPDILDDPSGFGHAFFQGACDVEKMSEGLGAPYGIASPGLIMKRYPCCGFLQRPIDAILKLVEQQKISHEDVEHVTVDVNATMGSVLIHPEPRTGPESKFSMPYSLAAAMVDKRLGLETFTDERVLNPKLQEVAKKVEMKVHPDWPAEIAKKGVLLTIKLKDGRTFSHQVDMEKGSPQARMAIDALTAKYRDCAKLALSPQRIEKSMGLMLDLENLKNVAELSELIM